MFKSIEATNFLSWKHLYFEIPDKVTLIEGFNYDDQTEEGSGKSSIPNALCWGLFGRIPKQVRVDDVISQTEKGCSVRITLTDGTQIERTRNPNRVRLLSGVGKSLEGVDHKATQEMIDKAIGFNFDTFCQCVYFAQNHANRFISCTPEQKSDILSKIINAHVYDAARTKTKQKISVLATELQTLLFQESKEGSNLELIRSSLGNTEQSYITAQRRMEASQAKIVASEQEITALKEKMDFSMTATYNEHDAKSAMMKLQNLKTEKLSELNGIEQKRKTKFRLQADLKDLIEEGTQLKQKVEKLRSSKDICPLCGSELKSGYPDHMKREIEQQEETLNRKRQKGKLLQAQIKELQIPSDDKLRNELEELDQRIQKTTKDYEQLIKSTQERKSASSLLEREYQQLKVIKGEYLRDKDEMISLEILRQQKLQDIAKLEQSTESNKKQQKTIKTKSDQLEVLRDAFKEIKAYSFQNVLASLSDKANAYAQELFEVPIELRFTNLSEAGEISKIEIIVLYAGEERALGLLSGGQARRVQLAVDLALSDIIDMSNSRPVKLLILDEVFKDLSFRSQEKMLRILSDLDKSILLIEHSELFKSIVGQTFKVELRNGVSTEVSA